MYLKKLYRYSKFWWIVVVGFIILQLRLDITHSAYITPFYSYGMYSEVMPLKNHYATYLIMVNNELLEGKNFTPQEWDKIIQPLTLYEKQQVRNDSVYEHHIKRLLKIKNKALYTNRLSEVSFYKWYGKYLENVIHKPVTNVTVMNVMVWINNNTIQRMDTLKTIETVL